MILFLTASHINTHIYDGQRFGSVIGRDHGGKPFSWVAVSLTHQNISKGRRLLDNTDMSLLKHSAVNLLDQEAGERCCLSDSPADL